MPLDKEHDVVVSDETLRNMPGKKLSSLLLVSTLFKLTLVFHCFKFLEYVVSTEILSAHKHVLPYMQLYRLARKQPGKVYRYK